MSTIISQIMLVYIVGTQPVIHVQGISPFSDLESCQQAISVITAQEKDEPEDEQIHNRLKCIKFSYRDNPDGDGPKKPVAPTSAVDTPHSPFPCRDRYKRVVQCKQTSYSE